VTSPDLVVVGAGTMGAWTALHARRGGREVQLIDAYGAGHPRATSGDETRIIRSSHGTDAYYARWSRRAREAWIELGEEANERVFVQAGCLWFAHREDGFEAASEATLRSLDIPVERVGPDDLGARWPQLRADDLAFAVHEPEGGLLMARRGVMAAVRTFAAEGGAVGLADVRPGRRGGRRLADVETSSGERIAGDAFVFACGPWLPSLFPELRELIRITRQDVLFFGPPAGDDRFDAAHLPSWVDYDEAFYGIPGVDGRGPKIAPDHYGPPFDPSTGDRIVGRESIAEARSFLSLRFPDLVDQPVTETRVCQYESTPDTHFAIDRHPDFDNVWIAGGGSGHGFKHGPVIGEYLVGLLDGAAATPDEERFSLTRLRRHEPGMRTGGEVGVTSSRHDPAT
jgi:glycine/D-amino acid oxidase-like deaminating enzyme